jgi:arabinose-5-phosphate isomerase
MGDALAIALLDRRGFKEDDFALLHPGGNLGKRLRRVETLMHSGEDLPRVTPQTLVPDVIYEISRKKLGVAAVVENGGKLAGIITDGDLRRLMLKRKGEALSLTAADFMSRNPVTIGKDELAATALRLMEERRITAVLVVDEARSVLGVVHLHDLWTLQLF